MVVGTAMHAYLQIYIYTFVLYIYTYVCVLIYIQLICCLTHYPVRVTPSADSPWPWNMHFFSFWESFLLTTTTKNETFWNPLSSVQNPCGDGAFALGGSQGRWTTQSPQLQVLSPQTNRKWCSVTSMDTSKQGKWCWRMLKVFRLAGEDHKELVRRISWNIWRTCMGTRCSWCLCRGPHSWTYCSRLLQKKRCLSTFRRKRIGKGGKGSSAETTKRATFIGSRKHDLAAFPLIRLRGVRGFTFLFEMFDSLSFGVRIQSFFCL